MRGLPAASAKLFLLNAATCDPPNSMLPPLLCLLGVTGTPVNAHALYGLCWLPILRQLQSESSFTQEASISKAATL